MVQHLISPQLPQDIEETWDYTRLTNDFHTGNDILTSPLLFQS